jgi:hypothetical protein
MEEISRQDAKRRKEGQACTIDVVVDFLENQMQIA